MKIWMALKIFVYWTLVLSGIMLLMLTFFNLIKTGSFLLDEGWIRFVGFAGFLGLLMALRFLLYYKPKNKK